MNKAAEALARVLSQVRRVPKNGRNTFHKYDYTTESDLTDFLRPLLADAGLTIIPEIVNYISSPVADKKDTNTATVQMAFRILHAESGDVLGPFGWYGEARDTGGDKGLYKAITGSVKYFLFKTFLVSTGDDPEIEEKPEARKQQQPPRQSHENPDPLPTVHAPATATPEAPAPVPATSSGAGAGAALTERDALRDAFLALFRGKGEARAMLLEITGKDRTSDLDVAGWLAIEEYVGAALTARE